MDDNDLVMQMLIENVEDAEEQAANNIPRLYYHRQDPFLVLSDVNFIKHFRLNKDTLTALLDELTPFLQAPQTAYGLSCKTKAGGKYTLFKGFVDQGGQYVHYHVEVLEIILQISYQCHRKIYFELFSVVGDSFIFWPRQLSSCDRFQFFCGMSQSSVCRCIEEVTNALIRPEIIRRWIRFPHNIEELLQRRASFFHSTGIPGGIGIIDCTHVALVRPIQEEHIYVNRKNYHSLNVQLVCDENLEIIGVNTNFPGSTHDAYIWGQSNISTILERIYRREPQNNFFLLGDSGYPLRPWLLTPMRNPAPGAEEQFNNDFKRVRSKIEQCNGLLKNRFRCLLKHRVLHYQPVKAAKIAKACCVLHNICVKNRIPEPVRDEEFLNADLGVIQENQVAAVHNLAAQDYLEAGRLLRQIIIDTHYN